MGENPNDVLVVEDDQALNKLVCRYVQLAGYGSRGALDGNTALSEARSHPPRLVLLDLMLPDITGFEVCMELKRDRRTSHVPVIIVSALGDDDSRRRAFESGATAYLIKPILPDQLLQSIKQHAA